MKRARKSMWVTSSLHMLEGKPLGNESPIKFLVLGMLTYVPHPFELSSITKYFISICLVQFDISLFLKYTTMNDYCSQPLQALE